MSMYHKKKKKNLSKFNQIGVAHFDRAKKKSEKKSSKYLFSFFYYSILFSKANKRLKTYIIELYCLNYSAISASSYKFR